MEEKGLLLELHLVGMSGIQNCASIGLVFCGGIIIYTATQQMLRACYYEPTQRSIIMYILIV